MSILQYYKVVRKSRSNDELTSSSGIQLPNPRGLLSDKIPTDAIKCANAAVTKAIAKSEASRSKKGPYLYLTDAQHYEVGKKAAAIGTTNALWYYAHHYHDLPLTEPTVRRLKNEYTEFVKDLPEDERKELKELPRKKKQGRPLLLGNELDEQVCEYVKFLCKRGSAVNTTVVMGAGEGVVKSKDANLLKEHGGSIEITKGWAQSLLSRMGMVKRKACSKNKVEPEHFDIVKEQFLLDIKQLVDLEDIPPALIINWDQTAINYVPPASWTMEVEGSKRVDLVGKDDKRQITACFAGTMEGDFLPPQLVYKGKTPRCLPQVNFPDGWHVTYSSTHWCNESTMQDYVDEIILPYINKKRKEIKLPSNHPALLLFDNFKAQCIETLLTHIDAQCVRGTHYC